MCLSDYECVCVCVCVWDREREGQRERGTERERERETDRERGGAVDTTEKGLSCVWVGARNSVCSLCYVRVMMMCVCVCERDVYTRLWEHKEVFLFVFICACAIGQWTDTDSWTPPPTHTHTHKTLSDTHWLYCRSPAVLWPGGLGAMPPQEPRGSGRTQAGWLETDLGLRKACSHSGPIQISALDATIYCGSLQLTS